MQPPITEQVITWLRAPWWLAVAIWASFPLVRPFILTTIQGSAAPGAWIDVVTERLLFQTLFAYLVVLSLASCRALYRRATQIGADLERLGVTTQVVRGTGSRAAPILLTAALALATVAYEAVTFGPAVAIVDLPLVAIPMLPIMTFVWIYFVVLMAVRRLGGEPLRLDRFPLDPMLGLSSVGSLAWTAFWLLLMAVLPAVFLSGGDVVAIVTGIVVLLVGIAAFFLSMLRLHWQMERRKDALVSEARALFVAAYEPVRREPTAPALARQAESLNAAKGLAEIADKTRVWPLDSGVFAKAGAVLFGVITALVVRAVFALLGLG